MKPAKNDLYDRYGDRLITKQVEMEFVDLEGLPLPNAERYVPYAKTDHPVYSPWLEPEWEKYESLAQGGLLSSAKICFLQQLLANMSPDTNGEIWELGVLNGTTARILNMVRPYTTMRLFDTFSGVAGAGQYDLLFDGDFQGDAMKAVQELLPNAHVYGGMIPETFRFVPKHTQVSFAHIDLDLYQPTLDALEEVYPRMPAGFIVVDDYGNWATPGVKLAVDTFMEDKRETVITQVTSQALIIKGIF